MIIRALSLITALFFCFSSSVSGQTDPNFQFFQQNAPFLNPAAVGAMQEHSITTHYRNQWNGLFQSGVVGYQKYIDKQKSGIGMNLFYDKEGSSLKHSSVELSYNYRFLLGEEAFLNAGISVAGIYGKFEHNTLRASINIMSGTMGVGVFENTKSPDFAFNAHYGFWLQWKKFNAGISGRHLPQPKLGFKSFRRTWYLQAGYDFEINNTMVIRPAIQFMLTEPQNYTKLMLTAGFLGHLEAGITYQPDSDLKKIGYLIGGRIGKLRLLGFYQNDLNIFGDSFEFLVQYEFSYRRKKG